MINLQDRLEQIEIKIEEMTLKDDFFIPPQLNKIYIGARKIIFYIRKNPKDKYTLSNFVEATKMDTKDTMASARFLAGTTFKFLNVVFYQKEPEYKEITKSEFNKLLNENSKNTGFYFVIK